MRLLDEFLTQFDDALEWQLDDPLLADHRPSQADENRWPLEAAPAALPL